MVSKIFITGQPFRQTCLYVCQDLDRAEILTVNGVRTHDLSQMIGDFQVQHRWMPEKEKPVFHGVLSFSPGEDPGNEKLVEIAQRYMREIGMEDTQHAIVRHNDRAHVHLHIIANKVDNTGEPTGKGLVIERGIEAARKLTQEYKLIPESGKHLERTNLSALHAYDARRYLVYQAIQTQLPGCLSLVDLEKRLLLNGITLRYKYDQSTGERQGISFRIGNYCYKGSRVDKRFSLKGLEQTIALQLKQEEQLRQRQDQEERPGHVHRMRHHL
jgi:hypothetical protein